MKRITLPNSTDPKFAAHEVLKTVVNSPVGGGVTIADMRKRLRLLEAIEAPAIPGSLLLEDADHALLLSIITNFPFGVVHKDIERIVSAVENAQVYLPNSGADAHATS